MKPVLNRNLKAPFPYFGGKGQVTQIIWKHLGDVKQYIEPFFGSGAVLLQRPSTRHKKIYEIVNDKDGFIANVWRGIIFDPEEVARWCDWPINHADLIARRKALLANEKRLLEGLTSDPEWYDAKMAGYWIWAASSWIGSGLTRIEARPDLTCDRGIHSKIPHLTDDKGIQTNNAFLWMSALQKRLRNVKVVCGDWSRVCGGNWQACNKPVGMFFDPPYATSSRDEKIYHQESMTVGKDVEKWALDRGDNPDYRIVIAGYDDEYSSLVEAGWKVFSWKTGGGYSKIGGRGSQGHSNAKRERLYISPHCEGLKLKKKGLF